MLKKSLVFLLAAALPACATDPSTPDDSPVDDPAEPTPEPEPDPIASGSLDPTFGTGGIATLDVGHGYAAALTAHGDGLLACVTHLDGAAWTARVIRLGADGQIDPTFGTAGTLVIDDPAGNVSCRDVAVMSNDNFVVAYKRLATGVTEARRFGPDGSPAIAGTPTLDFASKVSTYLNRFTTGGVVDGKLRIGQYSPHDAYHAAPAIAADAVARVYEDTYGYFTVVGRFVDEGVASWQVAHGYNHLVYPLGPEVRASAGTATPDLLADAIALPDGSFLAVGGMDSGAEVMAARFVLGDTPSVDVEHHTRGGSSMALSVALDGADRPIVVGRATDAGSTVFAWQRYEASSAALDPTYQIEGLATAAPPSGHGELAGVARLGDAMYALGSYDVETAAPKIALVRIVE